MSLPVLSWSTDLVGFHRTLHPAPTLTPLGLKGPAGVKPFASVVDVRHLARGNSTPADFYWTVCGYAPMQVEHIAPVSSQRPWLLDIQRQNTQARPVDLTAAWVDMDVREGSPYMVEGRTDYARLIPAVWHHVRDLGLPDPSLWLRSGRGLWALWVLRDGRGLPLPIDDDTRRQHRRVMQALAGRFAHFHADGNAIDVARFCRIPGTLNGSTTPPTLVEWARASEAVYALTDLADPLGVDLAPPPPRRTRPAPTVREAPPRGPAIDDASARIRARGTMGSYRARLDSLEGLAVLRGGIGESLRNQWVMFVAICRLRLNGLDEAATLASVTALNAQHCQPPLPDSELRSIVGSLVRNWRPHEHVSLTRMASALKVTEAERNVGLFVRRSVPFPDERRGIRADARAKLRDALEALLRDRGGELLGVREAVRALKARGVINPLTGQAFTKNAVGKMLVALTGSPPPVD